MWVDVVAIDIIVVAVAESVVAVAVNEVPELVAAVCRLSHNLSLHVLVHALFPHCLSCSEWGNGQN